MEIEFAQQKLESLRKQAIYLFIGAAIAFVFGIVIVFKSLNVGILILISAVGLFVCAVIKEGSYNSKVKEFFVVDIFQRYFDEVKFASGGFKRDFIRSSELIGLANVFSSNDLLSGKYRDVEFQQSDILVQRRQKVGKSSVTTTLFKGQYRVFEFNKRFTSYLQVRDKEGFLFGNAKPYQFFTEREATKKVKLENSEFNNKFDVYASDEHEAFYILTPHFMEKIMKLNESMNSQVLIGFIDNQLHVAVNNGEDFFEPSLWDPLDESYFKRVDEEIKAIIEIIDILDLD